MDAGKQNFLRGVGQQNQLRHTQVNREAGGGNETSLPEDSYSFGSVPAALGGDSVVANQAPVAEAGISGVSGASNAGSVVPTTLSFEAGLPGLDTSRTVGVAGTNGLHSVPQTNRFGELTFGTIDGGPREPRNPVTVAFHYGIEHAAEGVPMPRLGGGVRSEWGVQARVDQGLEQAAN